MLKDYEIEQKKQEIYKKYGIDHIQKLACHNDADGLTSGVFLTFVFKTAGVFCPADFGKWPIVAQGQEIPPDVCCDMIPFDPNWTGLAFDHHPGHPPEDQRKYKLVWGNVPTSLVVFNTFKDVIPVEQRWKVAVGLVGDGQPELIPNEVWKSTPTLLEYYTRPYEKYGKLTFSSFPIYLSITSAINAACKIPENWYQAYQVLRKASTPYDIIEDKALLAAKEMVKTEEARVIREANPVNVYGWLKLWTMSSKFQIERTLAFRAEEATHVTTLVINEETKRMSMRGPLAELVCEFLNQNGVQIHGHPGFSGGTLKEDQNAYQVYKILQKLKI